MNDAVQLPRVTINLMQGCLVATIQIDLNRAVLGQFCHDLLEKLASSPIVSASTQGTCVTVRKWLS
jgi:hypothetical protein